MTSLSYAIVTPARNEADNLRRLTESVESQTALPMRWVIVDDGSTDETADVARALAARVRWVTAMTSPAAARGDALTRGRSGGRDVVAFETGVASLNATPDVIVKLDADVSAPDYFQRSSNGSTAILNSESPEVSARARRDGRWRDVHVARDVRGAARAYRWACFEIVGRRRAARIGPVDLAKARGLAGECAASRTSRSGTTARWARGTARGRRTPHRVMSLTSSDTGRHTCSFGPPSEPSTILQRWRW
jgi:glycosyltransferase involved in cell wall biosynthesis